VHRLNPLRVVKQERASHALPSAVVARSTATLKTADSRITTTVQRTLSTYSELVRSHILALLATGEPRRYLYEPLASYPRRGGKGLRPALCIATARAFGGAVEKVLNSAVALELLHNAFLVHDDIEDGSEYRRGSPTLHIEYGIGIAVNVGDAMNAMSVRLLMENRTLLGSDLSWYISAEFEHLARQSVEGQAIELGWIRDNQCQLTDRDYLLMILKKTCWYTAVHPCRIGALIASQASLDLNRFNRFGYFLGAAFQIQDDILNILGDQETYGKEIGDDILEGKRTIILIHLLNNCGAMERERLRLFLEMPRTQRRAQDLSWIRGLMRKRGSIEYAQSCARSLASAALQEFFVAYRDAPESEHKEFIQRIIPYMIERRF
jgi:geranylgeranyl diphosphate synthase, type II